MGNLHFNHTKIWSRWREDGFGMEVRCHNERVDPGPFEFDRMWCTYLFFGDDLRFSKDEKMCAPYVEQSPLVSYLWENRKALNDLEGWNGGPSFSEFLTDERGGRRIKIGDDYAHLWDHENQRFKRYDLEYMQRRIQVVGDQAAELLRFLMKHPVHGVVKDE